MTAEHFQQFDLPPDAVRWLLDLWHVTQVWDDVADDDPIHRPDVDTAIFASLVSMPANPFFRRNADTLLPVVAGLVLKWKASDDAEISGNADARSYMWRAGYYDVVLAVVLLCHGPVQALHAAKHVMKLYGESFEDYRKEFPCQIPLAQ